MQLFVLFTSLTTLNVIVSTIKSIVTIRCGKFSAALVNAVAYAINTVAIVYTVCELSLWLKMLVVAVTNFIGVYLVKWGEEKSRKDKLWKIECTIPYSGYETLEFNLNNHFLPHNYILLGEKYAVFNIYCSTKFDTTVAYKLLKESGAKYFVSEAREQVK